MGCLFIQFIAFFAICDAFLKENIRLHLINKVLLYFFKTIHKTYESMREEKEKDRNRKRERPKKKREGESSCDFALVCVIVWKRRLPLQKVCGQKGI